MNKVKLSIIAFSCVMALGACSSSSKGGSDNSEQIRQAEIELNQRITEANKKAEAAAKKAEAAIKAAKNNSDQTEAEKKAAEERLKQLENLQADEKARIPLSDKIFGGISGEMKDVISGGVLTGEENEANRPLTRDIRDLTIIDESGKLVDINILRRAGDIDPWTYEEYDDLYNLRKEGQTILSNSNLQSSAFGTYVDKLTGNQYFYAQGLPTTVAQIPTTGLVEICTEFYYNTRRETLRNPAYGNNLLRIQQQKNAPVYGTPQIVNVPNNTYQQIPQQVPTYSAPAPVNQVPMTNTWGQPMQQVPMAQPVNAPLQSPNVMNGWNTNAGFNQPISTGMILPGYN